MENTLQEPAAGQEITFSVLLQTPHFRLSLHFYEATRKCSVGLCMMQVSNILMLQMMESYHSPLANAFGMAVCSSHDMFLINSGPKIPRKQTKTFFKKNYSHLFDTERKKGGFVFLILTGFSFWVTPSWKRLILTNSIA